MILRLLALAIALSGLQACNNSDSTDDPIPPGTDPSIYDWTFQRSPFVTNYTDIFFANGQVGWVVGENNTVLSTSTGGDQWPEAPVNSFEGTFRSVHLIDEQRGWIAGDMNGGKPDGSVYVSVNGGAYPQTQRLTDLPMNAVFMLDENFGWSGGENGQLIYTQDGKEWKESATKLDVTIYDLHFTDELNGWLAAANGNIYRSKDGGITWAEEHSVPGVDLFSIYMIDTLQGWACGEGNTILQRTNNGGAATWIESSIDSEFGSVKWNDLHFIGKEKGWIVGQSGAVYRTENSGASWTKESTGVQTDLKAIHMVSDKKGWIAGETGTILTYTP